MTGQFELICGCMFSGKSEEMIRRLHRHHLAGRTVHAYKPALDDRYRPGHVSSHAGRTWPCTAITSVQEILDQPDTAQIVGIDEIQFFDDAIVEAVLTLTHRGVTVIAAGLDRDALGRPFGPMPDLLAHADFALKLTAVCVRCGQDATCSQLLIDGQPAPWQDGPLIRVGAADSYEARCRRCFTVPGSPWQE